MATHPETVVQSWVCLDQVHKVKCLFNQPSYLNSDETNFMWVASPSLTETSGPKSYTPHLEPNIQIQKRILLQLQKYALIVIQMFGISKIFQVFK